MNPFTVEEMNLLAIYKGESKEEVTAVSYTHLTLPTNSRV